jgi:hypothetical protein
MIPIVPGPDPMGLPAPAWLLKSLLVATFLLHLLPMNFALGGGFVAAWASWRGRGGDVRHRALAQDLVRLLPLATAFAITLGIAPLLFLQVLYGQVFYASSVLMAWGWMGIVGLLLVGYYAYYGVAFRQEKGHGAGWALLGALCLTAIALLFVNNMTLMLRPEAWAAMYAADDRGLHLNLDDPALWPRFGHFLIASLALTGLVTAFLGAARATQEPETGGWMRTLGLKLFAGATLVQLALGVWFLLSLPQAVGRLFLGGSGPDTALLWTAVALAVVSVPLAFRSLPGGAAAIGLTVAGMALVRHRVREAALAPHFSADALLVTTQTGLFLAFAVILVLGLAVVGWMLGRFLSGPPATGTP